ncbi:stalk domain-containing protein [Cohnella sp.]|uniref:stalk domain-containing protein n=1 Tax=Cohnella sp. TaxID=1883426 RepID=UPI00356463C4
MKVRRLILLTLVFSLICGSAVYADSISQKVRVWVNSKEVDDGGIIVDGKAYISVRSVSDKLQALLSWDDSSKKVIIYKPNVHMITMQDGSLFGNVPKGKFKFNVFSQIDNLKVDISAFKVTISDPYGDETYIDGRDSSNNEFPEAGKEDFWFKSKEISYNFDSVGKYTVRFWIKPAGESSFQVVSEKVIKR